MKKEDRLKKLKEEKDKLYKEVDELIKPTQEKILELDKQIYKEQYQKYTKYVGRCFKYIAEDGNSTPNTNYIKVINVLNQNIYMSPVFFCLVIKDCNCIETVEIYSIENYGFKQIKTSEFNKAYKKCIETFERLANE